MPEGTIIRSQDSFYPQVTIQNYSHTTLHIDKLDPLKSTVIIYDCFNTVITINECKRIMLDHCSNCEIKLVEPVLCAFEISNSKLVDIFIRNRCLCVQAELCTGIRIYVCQEYAKYFKIMHDQCSQIQVFNERLGSKHDLPESFHSGKEASHFTILNMEQILKANDSFFFRQNILKNSNHDIVIINQ
jgi:hypothetical protein